MYGKQDRYNTDVSQIIHKFRTLIIDTVLHGIDYILKNKESFGDISLIIGAVGRKPFFLI